MRSTSSRPEPFDRAGREVLGEDIGLLHHLLDEHQASSRSQVAHDSALEQSGFELSVPLALKLVVSRKRELDGGILIGDDDGMIP